MVVVVSICLSICGWLLVVVVTLMRNMMKSVFFCALLYICSTTNHLGNTIHRPQNPSQINKKKEKKKTKKTHPNPPPSNQTPPHHRPNLPRNQIHPFTTSPPSAPSSTPSSPPPSSPTPPPSASADPPQTESIHPAYTSQYAHLHH